MFVYVIMSFPPFGYQPARADNRKSCILNGERLSHTCDERATEFVTSDTMALRDLYGAIILFRNEIQYLIVFL